MACRVLLLSLVVNFLIADTVKFGGELYMDSQNAQNIGMGGYSASFSDGRNPALLIHAHEPYVQFSHKNKFDGLARVSSLSYLYYGSINGKQSPIYFSIINRNVNNIPDTRDAWIDDGDLNPERGEINYFNINEISQNEIGLKVSFLRKYDKFALGISIKPTYTNLAEYSAWGFSGDIAAIVPLSKNKMEFSLRAEDIIGFKRWNTRADETNMPLIIAGGQIQTSSLLLGIEAGSHLENNNQLNYHAGFEFHQNEEMVIIRGGISHDKLFCLGIGLDINLIHIDYAYSYPLKTSLFKLSHIVSVGILLNKIYRLKGKITS